MGLWLKIDELVEWYFSSEWNQTESRFFIFGFWIILQPDEKSSDDWICIFSILFLNNTHLNQKFFTNLTSTTNKLENTWKYLAVMMRRQNE